LKVGFYHYARPETGNAPQQEAGAFLEAIAGLPCDLPLVLDVEGAAANVGPDTLTDWVYEWLTEVQRRTGNRVMVYTYAAFARENLGAKLADFPLWIAHYGVDRPGANATWSDWAVFQYASDGNVLGIDGNVDVDEMDINFWKGLFEVSEETNDAPQITEDAANKVIADLGALYEACADEDVKAAAHLAAEALRQAAGITEEE
jgi:lysozyme